MQFVQNHTASKYFNPKFSSALITTQSKAPKILWAFKVLGYFLSLGLVPKDILSIKSGTLCYCINA